MKTKIIILETWKFLFCSVSIAEQKIDKIPSKISGKHIEGDNNTQNHGLMQKMEEKLPRSKNISFKSFKSKPKRRKQPNIQPKKSHNMHALMLI